METGVLLAGIVGLFVSGYVGYLVATGQRQVSTVYAALDQFQDALTLAPDIVRAVEQLWQTGAIPKDERLNEAMKRLGEWFPDLTEQQLRTAIEAGVFLLKSGIALTMDKK